MGITAGRILKAGNVKVEGKFVLDIMQSEPDSSKQTAVADVEPQVRIVESKPDFSIIEITCSCGTLLNLKCEYTGSNPAPAKSRNEDPKVQNKEK